MPSLPHFLQLFLRRPAPQADARDVSPPTTAIRPSDREPTGKLTILFYNRPWISIPDSVPGCPVTYELTYDKSCFEEADAVVFHIPTLRGPINVKKPQGQKWVALSMESDINYPILNNRVFMQRFDLSMTYRRDADVWSPYLGPKVLKDILNPPQRKTEDALAVYFASSNIDRSGRNQYVQELMSYIKVDSYGRRLRNKTLEHDEGRKTKLETIARYKFTLAFENSISKDYVTEKFFDPLIAGSVPVYLGAPNIDDFAPAEKCFINVADFKRPQDLARYLRQLDENHALYEEYLSWKEKGLNKRFTEMLEYQRIHPICRLCMKLQANL